MTTLHVQPKTAIKVGHFTPGTPEWFEARKSRLGGSEISAVIGRSPFDSHLSLWLRKQGLAPAKEQNPEMEWGNRLEGAVLQKFAETRSGWYDLGKAGSFVHVDRPWQLSSPDGLHAKGEEIVEAKTAQQDLDWGEPLTREVPIYYLTQALWNMSVLDAGACWMPVLIRGCIYREYLIVRDSQAEEEIAFLLEQGEAFIRSMEIGDPPAIDGHDETLQIVRASRPGIEPGQVTINDELRQAYLDAVIAEKEIATAKNKAMAEILVCLGLAKEAVGTDGRKFAERRASSYFCQVSKGIEDEEELVRLAERYPPYLRADDRLIRELRGPKSILEAS